MSEPVGNSPRDVHLEGNSHKKREAQQSQRAPAAAEPREELSKIVVGPVSTRKPSWFKRAARSMIADDATSVGDYLLSDVLRPALKNLIRDIVVGGTDRTLYGGGRGSRGTVLRSGGNAGPVSTLRERYSGAPEERRGLTAAQRERHEFDEVTLTSRDEAIMVIETLADQVVRYGTVSVADLYRLIGTTGSFADRNWGWTDLSTADVRQSRGGWLLALPAPVTLRR